MGLFNRLLRLPIATGAIAKIIDKPEKPPSQQELLDRAFLAQRPAPADDPAMLAAKAREMQMRRMNRGRGGTVLTGSDSTKLG